jgi:hypothetical protein
MQIFTKPFDKTLAIQIDNNETLFEVTVKISIKLGYYSDFIADNCYLVYHGKYITNLNLTLKDLDIKNDHNIHINYTGYKSMKYDNINDDNLLTIYI